MTKIADTCFIVMSEYGIQRMTKRQGGLKRGEVAVKIRMAIPEQCFAEPDISVNIDVPLTAVIVPQVEVEVLENINE